MRISTPEESNKAKCLIFAPPGHGKTRLLGTAQDDPRTSPTLILDFEGGVQTLVGKKIDVATIRDWEDYSEAHALLSDPKCKYRSVGVDSITETQVEGMLSILEKDANRVDPDLLAQQDWGVILVQMRRFVRSFKDLPMHVFMTALASEDLVPRVGAVQVPALQGAFGREVAGIMDTVAYLALEETEEETVRVLLLHGYPKFRIKARTPWDIEIPGEIEDPTVGKLLDTLGFAAGKE